MNPPYVPDYVAVGHVTVDLRPDGDAVLGGSALYAALAAARFGLRAAVLTRGNYTSHGDEITAMLARFAGEFEIIVQGAGAPTTFTNQQVAGRRRQTVHQWAGPIDLNGLPPHWRSARIIHLAPVAQEIDYRQAGRLSPSYLGITPQGWMRQWPSAGGLVTLRPLRLPPELLSRTDALVLNSEEQTLARDEVNAVSRRGLVAITRGGAGVEITDRGQSMTIPAFPVHAVDDLGAGDVFAAVLFLLRAEHEPVGRAGRMAAAAAALRVTRSGPGGVPRRDEVEAFMREFETAEGTRRPIR